MQGHIGIRSQTRRLTKTLFAGMAFRVWGVSALILLCGCSTPQSRIVGKKWILKNPDQCTDKRGNSIPIEMAYEFFPDGTLRLTSQSEDCAESQSLHREVLVKYRFPDKNHIVVDGSSADIPTMEFYEVEVNSGEMRLSREGKPTAVLVLKR